VSRPDLPPDLPAAPETGGGRAAQGVLLALLLSAPAWLAIGWGIARLAGA
jgi:hypothetical protein